jgi:serine/threonine-protein kinase RsbW
MHDPALAGHPAAMDLDHSSYPPHHTSLVQEWTINSVSELYQLRTALFTTMAGLRMPEGGALDAVPDKIAVVATELATNALTHGGSQTRVSLRRAERAFILDVTDQLTSSLPHLKPPDASRAGGLGLLIATRFSRSLGWYIENHTKHVWAEVAIPDWNAQGT